MKETLLEQALTKSTIATPIQEAATKATNLIEAMQSYEAYFSGVLSAAFAPFFQVEDAFSKIEALLQAFFL